MKRKIAAFVVLLMTTVPLWAQEKEEEDKEKLSFKEHLFTGGSVTVSFFNGATILGANPILGYKLTNWADAGIVFNYTYAGQRDVYEIDDKYRQFVYGGGVFARLYPVRFLFLQGQLEHNFTKVKYRPASAYYLPYDAKLEANSLLLGAGYTQGREPGSNTFYYFSVLFDVLKQENSPYVERIYNPSTNSISVRILPIIRAGVNIGLFEGGGRKRRR